MKTRRLPRIAERALFPSSMALVFTVIFTAVYAYITATSVNPRYLGNLIFAVPAVCFAADAAAAASGKVEKGVSNVLTGVLLVVFSLAMLLAIGYIEYRSMQKRV